MGSLSHPTSPGVFEEIEIEPYDEFPSSDEAEMFTITGETLLYLHLPLLPLC
jgi:hypothetical protein